MKVCKCPHIRHINSCINVTYDVIFFTPDETGSAMMNSTHISLLKVTVHCHLYFYLCKVKSMDDNCGEWVECMGVVSGCG